MDEVIQPAPPIDPNTLNTVGQLLSQQLAKYAPNSEGAKALWDFKQVLDAIGGG